MSMVSWTLQDAKNRFSEVVSAAEAGRAQLVTKRGRPAVYVLAASEYEAMREGETRNDERTFVEHLLAMPTRSAHVPDDVELFPRAEWTLRDVDFGEARDADLDD